MPHETPHMREVYATITNSYELRLQEASLIHQILNDTYITPIHTSHIPRAVSFVLDFNDNHVLEQTAIICNNPRDQARDSKK